MQTKRVEKSLYQILDANINRAREGLRVVEEIFRFVWKNSRLTRRCKAMRHALQAILADAPIECRRLEQARDSAKDTGRAIHTAREFTRKSLEDVLCANLHRVGEALRVMEEFSKLFDVRTSKKFKDLRYDFYDLEKSARKR